MPRRPTSQEQIKCDACSLVFNHRSSLSRHLRQTCGREQAADRRQKSCDQCVQTKARCSLDRPACERCIAKKLPCQYVSRGHHARRKGHEEPQEGQLRQMPDITPDDTLDGGLSGHAAHLNAVVAQENENDSTGHVSSISDRRQPYDSAGIFTTVGDEPPNMDIFAEIELATSSDPPTFTNNSDPAPDFDEISALALPFDGSPTFWSSGAYTLHGPGSQLVYNSMELILRVLRSWPGMLAEGFQTPPLFHHTQLPAFWEDTALSPVTPQLANCITITKMWHGQQTGAEQLVQDTILREVDSLLEGFPSSDEKTQLCILQVLVIYTILILSPSKGWRYAQSVDMALFARIKRTVQGVVEEDLYPQTEREQPGRLDWKAWVYITAKRRAVLALYLLHWAYSMYHGVQSFDCRELAFMPAPSAKVLWQARTEREWHALYSRWLERWKGRLFLQGEFAQVGNGIVLGERAERWLQEADEFGFIMMAIVNATDFQQGT